MKKDTEIIIKNGREYFFEWTGHESGTTEISITECCQNDHSGEEGESCDCLLATYDFMETED